MLEAIFGPGMALFEKTKWFREAGLDTTTIKRLVLIECRKNLSVLEPLDLSDGSVAQDAPIFVAIARCIQFDALEALLAPDDKANKAMEELKKISLAVSEEDYSSSSAREDETVGNRILRLYVRMYSVRTLAEVRGQVERSELMGIGSIKFRDRLRNIRRALVEVDLALSQSS